MSKRTAWDIWYVQCSSVGLFTSTRLPAQPRTNILQTSAQLTIYILMSMTVVRVGEVYHCPGWSPANGLLTSVQVWAIARSLDATESVYLPDGDEAVPGGISRFSSWKYKRKKNLSILIFLTKIQNLITVYCFSSLQVLRHTHNHHLLSTSS